MIRSCPVCRKKFEVSPARIKHGRGVHCSRACQYVANKAKLAKPVACACIGCGQMFMTSPGRLVSKKGAGKYCDRACRDRHWRGSLNPNWQGGGGVNKRGSHWQAIRRRIVERDGCCVVCGATGILHAHHVVPFRMFDDPAVANDEGNLVALCPPCHRREDARQKWAKVPDGGGALMFQPGGVAWQLAKERGLV